MEKNTGRLFSSFSQLPVQAVRPGLNVAFYIRRIRYNSSRLEFKNSAFGRLTTVSSNFKLLNFDGPVLQIFNSCCYNNDIEQMSNHR